MSMILQMPRPAEMGATRWQIQCSRLVAAFGALCNRVGLPGAVRDCDIDDELSGQSLKIQTSSRFTRISVNGRDYYFDRLSGRFDGTGCGCQGIAYDDLPPINITDGMNTSEYVRRLREGE